MTALTPARAAVPPSTRAADPAARPGQAVAGESGARGARLAEPGARLRPERLLAAMADDGLIDEAEAARIEALLRLSSLDQHALVAIVQRKPRAAASGKPLLLEALTEWLAKRAGLPYLHIDPLRVEVSRINDVMSIAYAAHYKILPVEVRANEVVIATAEPGIDAWVEELTQLLRRDIRRVVANPLDIDRYAVEFFALARSVKGAAKSGDAAPVQDFEHLVELGRSGRAFDANDRHVVMIVDWLWQYAFDQRASDIHLEPRRETGTIRFRIDGVLHNVYQVPASVMAAMTSRIKLLGRMDVVEKRRPQDGRLKTRTADGQEVELRLSTMPTAFGEKLVMRIFDPHVLVRDFTELGFGDDELARWHDMTTRPNGIVLVTGPTGSGKTTTLYTTLKQLATESVNVSTVEDPIEMVEPAFNQMQVQHGIDLGFADGVRALMRQDPDIIMVGEIRDLETAEMAIQAALTGHLVLSTLHTNDAPTAITRLLDLGVPHYLISATVVGVMAQRLVRTLCPACKADGHEVEQERWDALLKPYRAKRPASVYRPVGCLDCRMTGYKGRTGLYEILTMSDALRELVTPQPDMRRLREQTLRDGLKPLRVAGAMKIAAGQTTVEEVMAAAPRAEA